MKWIATSAQYSKKKALDIVKFKKANQLSIYKGKAKFKVEKEVYRGKSTGRWAILQDAKSLFKTDKITFNLLGGKK